MLFGGAIVILLFIAANFYLLCRILECHKIVERSEI